MSTSLSVSAWPPSPTKPYVIRPTSVPPRLERFDQDPAWAGADRLDISHVHPCSSDHHPRTHARLLYDAASLYVHFIVHDRFVRSVQSEFNSPVCTDSCVEFFVQPTSAGYFNFEINAGGTLHCSYIRDHRCGPNGFLDYTPLAPNLLREVAITHSLPSLVDPEITEPTLWQIACRIPLSLLERYSGLLPAIAERRWRGNLYKCADKTSHPHWMSWCPIGEKLAFHAPEYFGDLIFDAGTACQI